ncbi:hypothetical protein TNCV_4131381 [Trichonephila clavipes]|nr:hypothetical protein TNCV_4131381 [Trichonephila clavipes]
MNIVPSVIMEVSKCEKKVTITGARHGLYGGCIKVSQPCSQRFWRVTTEVCGPALSCWNTPPPLLAISDQSIASNGAVVDSRDLNLVFGNAKATPNKCFLSSPTRYTVEPSWPLVLLLRDATTTGMPVNFDYFCDFIDIFDDGSACARTRGHGTTPLRLKEDNEYVSCKLGIGNYESGFTKQQTGSQLPDCGRHRLLNIRSAAELRKMYAPTVEQVHIKLWEIVINECLRTPLNEFCLAHYTG